MQICRPEKTNNSFQLNAPLRSREGTHLEIFNISEILELMKLYQHVIELSTYFKYANLFKIPFSCLTGLSLLSLTVF